MKVFYFITGIIFLLGMHSFCRKINKCDHTSKMLVKIKTEHTLTLLFGSLNFALMACIRLYSFSIYFAYKVSRGEIFTSHPFHNIYFTLPIVFVFFSFYSFYKISREEKLIFPD